jgi:hypothetical protein
VLSPAGTAQPLSVGHCCWCCHLLERLKLFPLATVAGAVTCWNDSSSLHWPLLLVLSPVGTAQALSVGHCCWCCHLLERLKLSPMVTDAGAVTCWNGSSSLRWSQLLVLSPVETAQALSVGHCCWCCHLLVRLNLFPLTTAAGAVTCWNGSSSLRWPLPLVLSCSLACNPSI